MDAEAWDEVLDDFENVVNMTPKELERWLETDESKSVGESENGESKGRMVGQAHSRDQGEEEG